MEIVLDAKTGMPRSHRRRGTRDAVHRIRPGRMSHAEVRQSHLARPKSVGEFVTCPPPAQSGWGPCAPPQQIVPELGPEKATSADLVSKRVLRDVNRQFRLTRTCESGCHHRRPVRPSHRGRAPSRRHLPSSPRESAGIRPNRCWP